MESKKLKSYEITQNNERYSIEISVQDNESQLILLKLANKSNNYTNSFSFDELMKLSKAFKVCETSEEIYDLLCQKLDKKDLKISLSEKVYLSFNFTLPNDKVEEIKLPLQKVLSQGQQDSEMIDKINEKINALEEKNKFLEKEINSLKIENENLKKEKGNYKITGVANAVKEDKILFDIMSEIFYVSKYKLSKDLLKHLDQFGLSDEYRRELFHRFNSKIKKIYDVKTDGDTLIGFMTKVFGKKNIVTFHSLSVDDEYINVQIAFLNGKFEFQNNYFNFDNTELYTYGDYENVDGDYSYTSFRSQNSKLYAKIEFDCIYIIFYEHGNINFVAKIRDNFINNPVLFIDESKSNIEEFFENNSEDKVPELFTKYEPRELNVTDLVIYEMPEE